MQLWWCPSNIPTYFQAHFGALAVVIIWSFIWSHMWCVQATVHRFQHLNLIQHPKRSEPGLPMIYPPLNSQISRWRREVRSLLAARIVFDAKRGDIGSTSEAYASSAFQQLRCDSITASPYLGALDTKGTPGVGSCDPYGLVDWLIGWGVGRRRNSSGNYEMGSDLEQWEMEKS